MFTIVFSLFYSIRQGLRSRAVLQAEVLALRHQLLVLQRASSPVRWIDMSIPHFDSQYEVGKHTAKVGVRATILVPVSVRNARQPGSALRKADSFFR